MEYLSPKLDIVFKRMFGEKNNRDMLRDLLKTYFDMDEDEEDLILENTEITPEEITMKFSRLDLRISTKKSEIDVEVQINDNKDFEKRSVYYASSLLNSSMRRGEEYSDIKAIRTLNILDYVSFPQCDDFFTTFVVYDPEHKIKLTDSFSMHFVELPKIRNATAEQIKGDSRVAWAAFFNAKSKEDFNMLRENTVNPNVQKAVEVLGRLSLNGSVRQEAKIREDALFNERSALSAARKEGREEGRAKGKAEGRAEGKAEGLQEGIKIMSDNLRAIGISEEQIREAIRMYDRNDTPVIEESPEETETEGLEI